MTPTPERDRNELRDANSCIALGAGLGAMGTGTALLVGATCPLCVVFAPALIGYGGLETILRKSRTRYQC